MPPQQQAVVSQNTAISVKLLYDGATRRVKVLYKDLSPERFPLKVREYLSIPEGRDICLERYSDSIASYILLHESSVSVYKQLARAAKAKGKLRIKVTLIGGKSPEPKQQQLEEGGPVNASSQASAVSTSNGLSSSGTTLSDGTAKESEASEKEQEAAELPTLFNTTTACVTCDGCGASTSDSHFHCNECKQGDFDLCPACTEKGVTCLGENHTLLKRCMRNGIIISQSAYCRETAGETALDQPKASMSDAGTVSSKKQEAGGKHDAQADARMGSEPTLAQPKGESSLAPETNRQSTKKSDGKLAAEVGAWICNGCVREFVDSKHFVTCIDCPDYDLCFDCLTADDHGHDPAHEFKMHEDDVVVVNKDKITSLCKRGRNKLHAAYCDGCSTIISGVRNKCLDCPDWDYCDVCVRTASTAHPGHRFAALTSPIGPAGAPGRRHAGILCDGPLCVNSKEFIRGIRYKCVLCHDTDFCENCEAHPSNKHDQSHPLVKLRMPVRSLECNFLDADGVAAKAEEAKEATRQESPARSGSPGTVTDAATQVEPMLCPVKETERSPLPEFSPLPATVQALPSPLQTSSDPKAVTELNALCIAASVADGGKVYADQSFPQAWTLYNPGPNPWPKGCSVRFVGGDAMFDVDMAKPVGTQDLLQAMGSKELDREVGVHETAQFHVTLRAPNRVNAQSGETDMRTSIWRLKDAEGRAFGQKLTCRVSVLPSSFEAKPEPESSKAAGFEEPSKVAKLTDEDLAKSDVVFPKLEDSSRTTVPSQESSKATTPSAAPAAPATPNQVAGQDELDIEDLSSDVNDLSLDNTDYTYDTESEDGCQGIDLSDDDDYDILTEDEVRSSASTAN